MPAVFFRPTFFLFLRFLAIMQSQFCIICPLRESRQYDIMCYIGKYTGNEQRGLETQGNRPPVKEQSYA